MSYVFTDANGRPHGSGGVSAGKQHPLRDQSKMTKADDVPENPQAFPGVEPRDPMFSCSTPGMTLRDWFAGQALAGINANATWDANGWADRARASYEAADAMLRARSVTLETGRGEGAQ